MVRNVTAEWALEVDAPPAIGRVNACHSIGPMGSNGRSSSCLLDDVASGIDGCHAA